MALTRPSAAQLSSASVDFTDPLFRINKDQTGANNKDLGIIFERGSDTNVGLIWDESADQFALINTTETGTTSGNVSISSYAPLQISSLTVNGNILPSANVSYDLGSSTLMWRDIYVGPGSLYVNNKQVISDDTGSITISTDTDENLVIKTTGTGQTTVQSATGVNVTATDSGDITLTTSSGNIELKGTVEVLSGKTIIDSIGENVAFGSSIKLNAQNDLRFADADSTNYVGFQAPATVATNVIWTLPSVDGTNGQVLITNGSGTLSFTNVSTNLSIAGDTGTDTVSLLNDTLTFSGTANEITTAITNNTVTIGLPSSITTNVTGNLTGNADTASAWANARTITLGGVLSGNVSIDGSSNVTLTAAHTSDPVITLTGAVTGSGTMTSLGNVSITATVADDSHNHVISNVDGLQTALDAKAALAGATFTGDVSGTNLTLSGNLTVSGTTTYVNTTTLNIGDNIITLNADEAGTPSQNAGIEIERGTSSNVILQWNETSDYWEIASGGTTGRILTTSDEGSGNGLDADTLDGQQGSYYLDWTNVTNKPDPVITLAGDLSGSVTLTDLASGTLTATITKDPTITLTGDVTGSATMTNLGSVSISTTVAANSVTLGTDTTGNYVATITGTANEITVSGSGSESAAVTIALPDDVTIGDTLTVTGNLFVDTNTLYVDATNNAVGVGTSSPNTYGKTVSSGDIATLARGVLKFYDTDSSNYVGFRAASTVTSNVTWTLPASDGSSGQVLSTDGSGNLSWATGGAGGGASGYQTSTVTTIYGNDGLGYDLAEGPNQDGDETPFSAGGTDAFGVSLGTVYDSMEPIGSLITYDYADGEAYVGA